MKRAKYCIDKRVNISDKINFICTGCDKTYTSKQNLHIHMETCVQFQVKKEKENYDINIKHLNDKLEEKTLDWNKQIIDKNKQIIEKNTIIKELQDKLENIAIKAVSKSTTTNQTNINNYIQKLDTATDEYFNEQVPKLTIEHIMKGPQGYAEYALEYPFNNRLVCVDYSRRKVKYKNKDGKVITDPEMMDMSRKLFESINSRNKELIIEFLQDTSGTLDPVVQMEMMTDMGDYIAMVNRGEVGEKTDLYHDFVKNVCSKSVV